MRVSTSYGAFHKPRLAAGVGMKTGTAIWTTCAPVMVATNSLWIMALSLLVAAVVHFVVAWAFTKDHKLFEAYAVYSLFEDVYDSGQSGSLDHMFPRPKGFAKGLQF